MRQWFINKVFAPLSEQAQITCCFPDGKSVGTGTPVLTFQSWKDVFKLAVNPSLGFAEAWAHGRIDITEGSLFDLLAKIYSVNKDVGSTIGQRALEKLQYLLAVFSQGWTAEQSKRNVHHHYDLGNDFYRLFLDDDWQYSCAYFDDPSITLEEAQHRKKDHIARKLLLDGSQSVLDIGCGWGGMALHLAPMASSVTGITLSDEQLAFARSRIKKSNANITLEMLDYRQEKRKFDRIVSVGMLEHVGRAHLPQFFRQVSQCLKDDGVALIHTIGRRGKPRGTDTFIAKYIFPGGYLPSTSQLTDAINSTDLVIADMETLFLHYAETLRHWRERFMANRHLVVKMYSEYFARIWELYLTASEATFRSGHIVVYQIQLMKPKSEKPFHRSYMYPVSDAKVPAPAPVPEQGYSNLP